MQEEWIYGYKALFKGNVNLFNQKFEINKIYIDNDIGANGGYHFCKNIEDIFVFPQFRKDVSIYQVCGSGKIISYSNDYYGVYDVFAAEKIKIIKEISRVEIIQYFLTFSCSYHLNRLLRFIQLFSLNNDEIELFKEKYHNKQEVLDYIAYYQEGDKNIFMKRRKL